MCPLTRPRATCANYVFNRAARVSRLTGHAQDRQSARMPPTLRINRNLVSCPTNYSTNLPDRAPGWDTGPRLRIVEITQIDPRVFGAETGRRL